MKTITASKQISDTEAQKFKGVKVDQSYYDLLLGDEPVKVLKPDGSLLLQVCRGDLFVNIDSYDSLKLIQGLPDNRGASTGHGSLKCESLTKTGYQSRTNRVPRSVYRLPPETPIQESKNRGAATGNEEKRSRRRLKDGSLSKTTQALSQDNSFLNIATGIIGYFDRYPRFPFARETSFLQKHQKEWMLLQPFIRSVDNCFAKNYPERYAVQRAIADATAPDWIIKGTAFSTITVNKNWQTAVHKDAGDLKEGFGVMTYLQAGKMDGGYLVLPQYRIAVKLKSCDILLFDVHEWHGNTALIGKPKSFERITCVFYYRELLLQCGDAAYELERAKRCRQIKKLYDVAEVDKANKIKSQILTRLK